MPDAYAGNFPLCQTGNVPLAGTGPVGNIPAMLKVSKAEILRRIDQRLRTLGISAQAACIEAGLGKDVIRDMRRKPKSIPGVDTIAALAPVLEVAPEWLAFGVENKAGNDNARSIPIRGEVAAGLWHEVDAGIEVHTFEPIPFAFDHRYSIDAQYGLIVRGTSINRIAGNGDILLCLDIGMTGLEAQPGDLVIVERRRNDGGEREVTAKRFKRVGRKLHLIPDSDDQRWQAPIIFDPAKAGETEEISIIALVSGVYRPIRAQPIR